MDGEPEPPAYADPVARWVAEGLRDVEIAVRLGVSVGEARARRGALRDPALDSTFGLIAPPPLPPMPTETVEEGLEEGRPARPWTLVAASVVGVLAVAGGWWLLSSGSEPAPRRTVEVTAPGLVAEAATRLREGPSIPFPDDLSLIVRADGVPGGALVRIYRDAAGGLQREAVLGAPEGASIGRVVADVDGWLLVAALNYEGRTAFVRSQDGGVTWAEMGSLDGHWDPVGTWEGETIAWREGGGGLGEFVFVPSGEPFVPAYPAGGLPLAILGKGRLLWRVPGSGAIAEGDGSVFASPDLEQGSYHEWLAPQPSGAGTMISWTAPSPSTGDDETYVGIMTRRGRITESWFGLPGPVVGRRDGATLVATAPHPDLTGQSMAVLVPLRANTWHPIVVDGELLASPQAGFVVSVRQGPFVRVATSEECAPVRGGPQRDADVIACVADGVLLRAPGETVVHVDYTWEHVIAPGGRPGWVDISYVR